MSSSATESMVLLAQDFSEVMITTYKVKQCSTDFTKSFRHYRHFFTLLRACKTDRCLVTLGALERGKYQSQISVLIFQSVSLRVGCDVGFS